MAASRLRSTPTEVVRPVDVAVIDRCERLSITGGGAARESPPSLSTCPSGRTIMASPSASYRRAPSLGFHMSKVCLPGTTLS
jgi:hypothetical protein